MAAALLNASWNAIVKSASDKLLATILVSAAAATVAIVLLPFLAQPERASWPYLALSTLLQIVYYLLLAAAYKVADLSQAYPLMRGTAPLLVAIVAAFHTSDSLSPVAWLGVLGICVGILSMTAGSRFRDGKGVHLALANAMVIAGYTLIDGAGVRRSGSPAGYALWLFLLTGLPLTTYALTRRSRRSSPSSRGTGGWASSRGWGRPAPMDVLYGQ